MREVEEVQDEYAEYYYQNENKQEFISGELGINDQKFTVGRRNYYCIRTEKGTFPVYVGEKSYLLHNSVGMIVTLEGKLVEVLGQKEFWIHPKYF